MGFDGKLQAAIQKVAKQEDIITVEDVNKLFESFSVKSVLESKELPNGQTLMMYLCRSDQMTVPMMQLFIDEAKKISDENNNNNNNNEFLKKQLEFALGVDYRDQAYDQVPFISVACARTLPLPLIQLIFATCTEEFGKEWLLQQLQLGFGSTKYGKTHAIPWICKYARSVDVVRFVFSTFLEIGGKAALEKELDEVDCFQKSVLTDICSSKSCSVEMAQLVMDQYSAAGGEEFLKKHLTLEKDKVSALTIVATSSCSDSVLDFFLTKIGDVCGKSVLEQELSNPRTNPLTHVCKNVGNIGRAKLTISKIPEYCNKDTLQKCLQSKESFGFLYSVLEHNKSVEMLQLLVDTVKDNFGPEFAEEYLLDKDLFAGLNLLHIVVEDRESTARLELAIRTTLELGGPEGMKQLLQSQSFNSEMRSPLHNLCCCFSGDRVSEKKLKLVLDQMLSVGGKNFLKERLEAVHCYGFTGLHYACKNSTFATASGATATIKMLIDASANVVGGNQCLRTIFEKETSKPETSNLAVFLFHEGIIFAPRIEVIDIVLAKIVDVGNGKTLLRSYLNIVDKDGKPPLSFVSKDLGKFFVALLIELELFKGQFAKLDDASKEKLKKDTKIDSDEWQPSDELKNQIANLLMTKEEHDAAAAAKKKAEEEAAAKKKAQEEAVAKKKVQEEAVAKKKAEEDEAAARKMIEEEEAAAAKRKADEEAAAAATKKKAEEEAAAKKKAREEAAAAAAAKKKADEEAAAAAKKKADEEAAAAAKKKADEEAAAERTLKLIVVGGLLATVAGIVLFSLNKHN